MSSFSLRSLFTPVKDSKQQLRRHILWFITLRAVLFTLILGIAMLFQSLGQSVILAPLPISVLFLIMLYSYSIGSALVLQNLTTSVRRFGVVQLLSDTLFIALLVYGTGCSQSIFTPVFILPIIAGGLILHRIGGLIPAASATILYGIVLTLEYLNIIPAYLYLTAYQPHKAPLAGANIFSIFGLTFFLTAILSGVVAGRLRTTEEILSKTTLEFDRLSILYKQIFDDITTGIITTDHNDYITSYNSAAGRITGFPLQKILGQVLSTCFPTIELKENRGRNVCNLTKYDGTIIRVGYSFSQLNMPVDSTDTTPVEHMRWKVITLQDISKIERMERQVREAEKMAAIGELSASIAHDFRNPLAAISGSAQILSLDLQGGSLDLDTTKPLIDIVSRESDRMAKTVTDFLQFARPAQINAEWFDLKRLVDEVLKITNNPVKPVKIRQEIDANIDCWGDRQQIQTVLIHIIDNAIAFADQEQPVIVINGTEVIREGENWICIEIMDNGPGIGKEFAEKIFTPFFSTREDGTGLGLSIVRQVVENHHGRIDIHTGDRFATLIRINLPTPAENG